MKKIMSKYDASSIKKTEVVIIPERKGTAEEVMNATANFLSSSVASGNEKVYVGVKIHFMDDTTKIELVDEKPFVRNNLDYHEAVREARRFQSELTEK